MLNVFFKSGFNVQSHLDGGVYYLTFVFDEAKKQANTGK